MNLGKWVTISQELMQLAKGDIEFSNAKSTLAREKIFDHNSNKALGFTWDPVSDKFSLNSDQIKISEEIYGETITKRQLFSLGLKMYDPIP